MNLRIARTTLAILLAGALGLPALTSATAATASPINDLQAKAAAIQAQIDANGARISALAEAYNGAQYRYQQAQNAAASAQARIDQAQAQVDQLRGVVAARVVELYQSAGDTSIFTAIDSKNLTDLASRSVYASAATNHDDALVGQYVKARDALKDQKVQYDAAMKQAASDRDAASKNRDQIQSANQAQEQILSQVQGQVATLIHQQQAAAAAAEAAAARAAVGGAAGGGSGGAIIVDPSKIPASSPAAARAVAFALSKVGLPYQWGAAGPGSYDCSGLVMAAYASAGISLPHFSGAQFSATVRIPASALQPGDLIFWGPGGSDHEAMYIGGGQMVEAPYTGANVRVVGLRGGASGYGRVT